MEQRLVRKDIKKCDTIYYHSDYFLFSSKVFQSCAKAGGSLITYPEVKTFLHGITALPNNKLLIDDGKGVQHLLDLKEGKVLVSQKMTKKRMIPSRFAISADGNTAFRLWCWGKNWYLLKMNLADLNYEIFDYPARLNCATDIIVSPFNELHVLEAQVDDDGTCRNQISSVTIENSHCTTSPVYQWTGPRVGKYFDGRYVLESECWVRDILNGICFHLLENSDISLPEKYVALSHIYYPKDNILQLVDMKQTVFIDCEQRKIVARYRRDTMQPAFIGTRVGDEFWFGRSNGIYASPFPVIEDI